MIAQLQSHTAGPQPFDLGFVAGGVAVLLLVLLLFAIFLRKFLRKNAVPPGDWAAPVPDSENASAFMAASMQGVIEKLRTQEKELARLHLVAQERAQESERLTEEVTRNMPTGLLLVNATGAISTTNPAAEEALGIRTLRYRSYKEILGDDTELTRMLTACLRDGKHVSSRRGRARHRGRRNAPPRRNNFPNLSRRPKCPAPRCRGNPNGPPEMKVSGALCLMSDLTELTALQKQIRWKENLAALGEMSAGIAHEFKNALATISGYAQMIRSEARPAPAIFDDSAERILDQTRALTHVVTEFLRFAKPLEICYETVPMKTLIERVTEEMQEANPECRSSAKASSKSSRAMKRCSGRRSSTYPQRRGGRPEAEKQVA